VTLRSRLARRRLVRVLGVDVSVHAGWLVGFAFATVALVAIGLPAGTLGAPPELVWAASAAAAALFLGSILAHELTHAVVAERIGLHPPPVSIFIATGGAATLGRDTARPSQELAVAASAPLVSLALAGLFAAAGFAFEGVSGDGAPLLANLCYLVAAMNAILGALNLVPAFPLDGGRILRAILWRLNGDFLAATRTAANAGRAVGWTAVGAGALIVLRSDAVTGFTIVAVGWFLSRFATTAYRWAAIQRHVSGISVGQVMERDVPTVRPSLTLDVFIEQYLLSGSGSAFAVATGDELIGTIDVDRARRVPRDLWPTRRIADVMVPLADVETAREEDPLWPAIERFERGGLHLMPVVDGQRLLGVLTRRGLLEAIRRRVRLADVGGPAA
jgi:Zn-dependent protease/CBS domain-containing protein